MLRAFDEEQFAQEFVDKGKLRLSEIATFGSIPGAGNIRSDQSEGIAQSRVPSEVRRVAVDVETDESREISPVEGHLNFQGSLVQAHYVFCCSLPEVDQTYQAEKLGRHVVSIFETALFIERLIQAARNQAKGPRWSWIECFTVTYDHGSVRSAAEARSWQSYLASKPIAFEQEREVRIVLASFDMRKTAPTHVHLQLDRPADFCRWHPPPEPKGAR